MGHQRNMQLGGIALRQSSSLSLRDGGGREFYAPFRSPSPATRVLGEVNLSLTRVARPSVAAHEPRIFDGEAWQVYGDDSVHHLACPFGGGPELLWLAELAKDSATVALHCGPHLVEENDNGQETLISPLCYPLDQLLMMYILSGFLGVAGLSPEAPVPRGVLLHCAALTLDGYGVVLPGRSGAGKSTLSRLLLAGGHAVELMSDDRAILRDLGDDVGVFGTPWPGDAGIVCNTCAPLRAIVFLEKAGDNALKALTQGEAVKRILRVMSVPWYDPSMVDAVLGFVEKMLGRVPAYEFAFRPDAGAAELLVGALGERCR